jgi:hypothetical protein
VEPKTLGWEHSKSFLENVFENLGVASTPLRCFTNGFEQMVMLKEDKGVGDFQMTLVITRNPPEQFTRTTTLHRYGTGPSSKFICFSAGASHYIRVCRTPESGLLQEYGQ